VISELGLPFDVPIEPEPYTSSHKYDLSDWAIDPTFFKSIEMLEKKPK
jgi:hypothetical protein